MAINKIIYESKVLLDLTQDSVTQDNLLEGAVAHNKAGERISGKVKFQTYYTGTALPSDSLGVDGDLYFKKV